MKWRCLVCEYVHDGDTPPEICPVCGVDSSNFVKVEEEPQSSGKEKKKSWRCLVCNYIHVGDAPPDTCPVCGVDASHFVLVTEETVPAQEVQPVKPAESINMSPEEALKNAIRAISYGLFIITASAGGKDNGQTANTCFQITSDPVQIAIGINKNNYTHQIISESNRFGVAILDQNGHDLARKFGYRSGKEINKFEGIPSHRGVTGVLLPDQVLATLEAEVVDIMDAGTHTLFLGKVVSGEMLGSREPMTYAYFRSKKY